ncbi:MAG: discoidin domain-containing protein [Opitutaceae bacterium]|jgi:hypothetical protein|nr:discoidin domain-containing protein [Opitutaceae bacterium]
MPSLAQYPGLSSQANALLAAGAVNPAPFSAFKFTLLPGQNAPFDQVGNFAYIGRCNTELEIAFDDSLQFSPWDVALAADLGREHFFRRVTLKNPTAEIAEGVLYAGFITVSDHRQHVLGEQRVTMLDIAATTIENTFPLADTAWHTVAPVAAGKREVWLAVERTDGDPEGAPVRAFWRANSGDAAQVPSREIGLALDGITRLPFSDRIDISTNAAGAGAATVRCWIVSFVEAGSTALVVPPQPGENLLLPQMSGADDTQGIGLSANSNAGDLWKLFDRDLSTEYVCGNIGESWFTLNIDLGAVRNISRLAAKWNNTEVLNNGLSPHYIRFAQSADNANWSGIISNNTDGLCVKPVSLGQTIFAKEFADGLVSARYIQIQVLRPWNRKAGASYFRLAALELYTKDEI